jgi:phosphopantothenoylcysteine decarboxylase/phosphopantothenate--cysteine ligase
VVRTPDVLMTASAKVQANPTRPVLVGFAAETHEVINYAKGKLTRKGLDLIVANDVSAAGAGFAVDTNQVTFIGADGTTSSAQGSKREIAAKLWDLVAKKLGAA